MNSSTNPTESWTEKAIRHTEQKGKITNGFGALSLDRLAGQLDEQAKNEQAENEAYRRQLGAPASQPEAEDSMRQIVLGDYTENHPPPAPKKTAGRLAAAALMAGALGPAGVAGGYALNEILKDDPAPVVRPAPVGQPGEDETADLKLGRIEDYTDEGDRLHSRSDGTR